MWGMLSVDNVAWAGIAENSVPSQYVGESFTYKKGWIEKIASDKVIQRSFYFLSGVLLLLLVLINAAGRRWEREGRYKVIDQRQ